MGGIEVVADAGCGAVGQHVIERLQTYGGNLVPAGDGDQLHVIIRGQGIGSIHQHHMDALGGEVTNLTVDDRGAHSGPAVFLKVVKILTFLMPAGGYKAFLGEEVTGDRRYYNSSLRLNPYPKL